MTNDCLHALRTFLADWPVGQRYAQALSACFLAPAQAITAPPVHPEPSWWRGHSPYAVAVIVLIVFVSVAQVPAGYLLAPPGLHFTGAPTYAEDVSVHELYAAQMAAHLRYQNLMTPEPTPRGWFFHPLDAVMGLAQKATGIPFMALVSAVALASAPALAFGLMTMARRAGLDRPGVAAVIALLAGSFAPLVHGAAMMGLIHGDIATVRSVGGDATPIFAGHSLYLVLVVFVLAALPMGDAQDPARGFRLAGILLFVLAAVYPFFIPTLWLTTGFCALLWARRWGWRPMLKGVGWLGVFSALPILYWAVLPWVDSEYARFAAFSGRPLFSPLLTFVSLGLGSGAIIGIPRLLRANAYQQMLACFAAAFIVALYVPAHPWRSHIFYLSPMLVIGAIAAWWPMLLRLRRGLRWILVGGLLAAATASIPYYYARQVSGLAHFEPPTYLTSGDVAAIQWIAGQPGTDVVLARPDLSLWVASKGHHRVVVGNYYWTHEYGRRRAEVQAIFEDRADPRALLRAEQVAWVIIDEDRGLPAWARGVKPAARFDQTVVLRADRLLEHLEDGHFQ
ncbi:MAG TPA: hypothetical protein VKK81_03875 [Candidatus Binatia bacterium]|nr:hypothetical protein [Candidatus Binatia bacterium]